MQALGQRSATMDAAGARMLRLEAGSGSIDYDNVRGRVDVPRRKP